MRQTVQTEGNITQRPISTVFSILCITDSSLWLLLYRLEAETKQRKILLYFKKTDFEGIALRLSPWSSVLGNVNELISGTVFEYHIYELFKFSLALIRNVFQNLTIGVQQKQTRKVSFNIWKFFYKIDILDSRPLVLMNALRKWSVFPSD